MERLVNSIKKSFHKGPIVVSVKRNNMKQCSSRGKLMLIILVIRKYSDLLSSVESCKGGVISGCDQVSKELKFEYIS